MSLMWDEALEKALAAFGIHQGGLCPECRGLCVHAHQMPYFRKTGHHPSCPHGGEDAAALIASERVYVAARKAIEAIATSPRTPAERNLNLEAVESYCRQLRVELK